MDYRRVEKLANEGSASELQAKWDGMEDQLKEKGGNSRGLRRGIRVVKMAVARALDRERGEKKTAETATGKTVRTETAPKVPRVVRRALGLSGVIDSLNAHKVGTVVVWMREPFNFTYNATQHRVLLEELSQKGIHADVQVGTHDNFPDSDIRGVIDLYDKTMQWFVVTKTGQMEAAPNNPASGSSSSERE
ncbi:MAG: hypothetical protein AAB592_00920 [Patescibacteria group bacterium]